jgi:hypothetical protein
MKEPHNYRKVGYSMILISVSLSVIGLVVWAIGDNYHFGSNLMAGQEVDIMTPNQGYNIISFDHTAPVGAKLRLLDHADSINDAKKLQDQYLQSTKGVQILIFGNSRDYNVDLMAHAEVAALTPVKGYNIISFNHAYPVGAKLAMNIHDDSLVNATKDEQKQKDGNKDSDVSIIVFSSSYNDNLMTVLGSGTSSAAVYDVQLPTLPPSQTPYNIPSIANTSATTSNHGNESVAMTGKLNTTAGGNQTTIGSKKSVILDENMGITSK